MQTLTNWKVEFSSFNARFKLSLLQFSLQVLLRSSQVVWVTHRRCLWIQKPMEGRHLRARRIAWADYIETWTFGPF